MPRTVEEEYLSSLWDEPKDAQDDPLLMGSKVIQQSQARSTYQQLAASGTALTTLRPPATVHISPGNSPLRGTAATMVASLAASTASPDRKTSRRNTSSTQQRSTGGGAGLIGTAPAADDSASVGVTPWVQEELDIDAAALRQEIDGVINNVAARQSEYESAAQAASKAAEMLDVMQAEIEELQQEEDTLAHATPPAPERLRKVQKWAEQRRVALQAQQELAQLAAAEAAGAEAGLRAAEAELDFLADTRQALDATFAADADARRDVMAALRVREERAARGYLARLQKEANRLEKLKEQQEELKQNKIEAAEVAREAALERLSKSLARVKANLAKGQQLVEQQQAARRDAVMELKDSLAQVRAEVAKKATLYQQLQKQKRNLRDKEFQDLIEQGLNPYEVHRRRELQAQATRQRTAMRQRIEARQVEVASKLAREEEAFQRQLIASEQEKQVMLQFQKEQGRAAAEARVDVYMQTHTTSGQSMLDPTGRAPVDPSSATVAKTRDFGSGHSAQALLDKMTAKHPHVKPKEVLMPYKYRQGAGDDDDEDDEDDDSSEEGFGARSRAYTERSALTSAYMSVRSTERDADIGGRNSISSGNGKRGGGWKHVEQTPLSKLERANLDAAKARHKKAIAAPKVMMGREFSGDAFITSPTEVLFSDFDVGGVYTATVAITNRSYSKNTYRVLQVPPEYGNVLEVNYQLPGHLATGMSGEIVITFTPKSNEDILTHVAMLAETGPFHIPVRCLPKRAQPVLSTSSLDFGPGVILGEMATRVVTLSNQGALEVEYHITSEESDLLDQTGAVQGVPLSCPPFTISSSSGTLKGYSTVVLNINFSPNAAQTVTKHLKVTCKSLAHRKLHIPPISLELIGIGRDVPIFLEREVIDFKCVMFDHTYREKLVVRNGGKTAMKVSVANRPNVSDYIEFSPDFGFVQAGQVFPITVLFKPRASMLSQCDKFFTDPSGSILQVPLKVHVPDQKLPVCFTVRAHVTSTDLVFSPPALDFGPCVMAEDTGVVLRVTNPSALPQTFGFAGLPPSIRVAPNDGFGHILPGETVERIVSFQPPIPGPQSLTITARSLAGRSFTLPITATGVQPTLSLSHNKLAFPATPINDVRTCSVVLRNHTPTTQAFEFGVPADSGLVFIPHVGQVPASGNQRIQINFQPIHQGSESPAIVEEVPEPPADTATTTGKTAAGKAGAPAKKSVAEPEDAGDAGVEDGEVYEGYDDDDGPAQDPSTWYDWRNFSVPCFIRPPAGSTLSTSLSAGGSANDLVARSRPTSSSGTGLAALTPSGEPQVLHLNIVACAVNPDLILRTELPWIQDKRCYELNFGPVPVGQRVTRSVELFNQGKSVIPLRQEPLDHRQVFNTVAAWRDLAPGGRCRTLLAFQPLERAEYLEVLTIISSHTQLRIALKGQGIAPQLKVTPPAVLEQGLDLGDVSKGETSEARLSITNVCPFPLSWGARFNGVPDPNLQNRQPFYCRPAEGTLAQGESCDLVVTFRPSQQKPYYSDTLQLYVPNQQEQIQVALKGRGWNEGIYLSGPTYPEPAVDPFLEHQLADLAGKALAAASESTPATPDVANTPPPAAGASKLLITPACIGGPGTPSPMVAPSLGVIPMAPVEPKDRHLTATFPQACCLGEVATYVLEVGSLKSVAGGSAAGEVILEGLTAADTAAGWAIDNTRVALAAGDKKPISITYTVPSEPTAGMAALWGHAEYMQLQLVAILKGGSPPPPTPEGRRVRLTVRVLVQPHTRPAGEPLPPGVRNQPSEEEKLQAKQAKPGKK